MPRPLLYALSASTLVPLVLAGCAPTHVADIGTPVAVSHPIGAYSHEFRWGNNADVVYLVDNAAGTDPGRVDFDLNVTVPDLGRMFGFVNLEVTCVVGGEASAADTHERLSEDYSGEFEFPMWCAVPEGTDHVTIEIDHHDEHLRFEGVVG
ncbi:hypothetical protein ACFO4E_08550 [Nocardiopsis mangrovi]|uniref:Lipoprotein n=1 Tax=Nocardiopsis mangrovi TaxID=1179818 RepID=A0ABV9DU48_9ACTN